MTVTKALQLRSPAKINIFLEVHGKREDGFHELETVMLRTDLCDVIQFEAANTDEVSLKLSSTPRAELRQTFPLDDSNLIIQAANALNETVGGRNTATITVEKRIPAAAGLAGGSGNAATTLMGLNTLWELGLPTSELHRIASTLGSDINFFVANCRAAVCRGRGEEVSPFPLHGQLHIVAARPITGNSTPHVFSALQQPNKRVSSESIVAAVKEGNAGCVSTLAFNRLTEAARALNPEMCELMTQMQTTCRRSVFMSGSGSTCYVFARSRREALRLERQLANMLTIQTTFLKTLRV